MHSYKMARIHTAHRKAAGHVVVERVAPFVTLIIGTYHRDLGKKKYSIVSI
jgi:hypothetical protein